MSKLSVIAAFIFGAAGGFAVGTILQKRKCNDIVEKEIASVKEAFSKETHIFVKKEKEEKIPEPKAATNKMPSYGDILKEIKTSTEGGVEMSDPYIITPESYGEFDDYERANLIYYQEDGVIATESDEIIDSPDDIIGLDSLKHFGDYTHDCIYVRNDALKTDYEILRDPGSFEDMMRNKPYANEEDD